MTVAQEEAIRAMAGRTPTEISKATGIPRTTIREFLDRESRSMVGVTADEVASDLILAGTAHRHGRFVKLDREVRPLAVDLPPAVAIADQQGEVLTAVLYGDTHYPSQDERTLAIVAKIAEEEQPNFLVHMGDLVDCYALSHFDKDPDRLGTLQDDINQSRLHLAYMRQVTPKSSVILLEGNHEDRLRRTMWNLQGTAQVLYGLTNFRKGMTWPALLGLDDLGITWLPYDGSQTKQHLLPKWILKHGTVVRTKSAYTARAEWEKYGRSGSSGHSHRLGMYFHRDHNGSHCWVETGCTCKLDPDWMPDANWQQGCVVMTFEPQTGAFQAEPVYIYNGLAVWRGKVYRA